MSNNWNIYGLGVTIEDLFVMYKEENVLYISKDIDFGKKWYSIPCSNGYRNSVTSVFNQLTKANENGTKWGKLPQRNAIVKELLTAIVDEIELAYKKDPAMAKKFARHIIGGKFYHESNENCGDKTSVFYAFNIQGKLDKEGDKYPITKLPDELIKVRIKPGSRNVIELYFNEGWQIQLKLCTTGQIQPILEFEVTFIGLPTTARAIVCRKSK